MTIVHRIMHLIEELKADTSRLNPPQPLSPSLTNLKPGTGPFELVAAWHCLSPKMALSGKSCLRLELRMSVKFPWARVKHAQTLSYGLKLLTLDSLPQAMKVIHILTPTNLDSSLVLADSYRLQLRQKNLMLCMTGVPRLDLHTLQHSRLKIRISYISTREWRI
jgi:hypothetical protein